MISLDFKHSPSQKLSKKVTTKELLPKNNIINLQATELERYGSCPLNYWFGEAFKKKSLNTDGCFGSSLPMARGEFLHKTVSRVLDEYKTNSTLSPHRALTIWTQEASRSIFSTASSFIQSGMDYVASFHKYFFEEQHYDIRTVAMEEKLENKVTYKNFIIRLAGRFDHLNSTSSLIDINDWKFVKEAPRLSSRDKLRGYYQLAVYAKLLNRSDISQMINFEVSPSGVTQTTWDFSEATCIDVEKLYSSVMDQTLSDLRKPKNWEPIKSSSCSHCRAKKRCPQFGGILPAGKEIEESQGIRIWDEYIQRCA